MFASVKTAVKSSLKNLRKVCFLQLFLVCLISKRCDFLKPRLLFERYSKHELRYFVKL